jgi:hypothetical protein
MPEVTNNVVPGLESIEDMERQENGAQRQLADTSHQLQEAEESWAQREPVLEMELGEARKSILARQVLLNNTNQKY